MHKIVIYQHDPHSANAAADALRHAGYCVYSADTAVDALEAALSLKADLVITDFPALLGGEARGPITLSQAIREHPELRNTRLLNLATSAFPHVHEHALRAGVDASMRRPPDSRHVVNHIGRLIPPAEQH